MLSPGRVPLRLGLRGPMLGQMLLKAKPMPAISGAEDAGYGRKYPGTLFQVRYAENRGVKSLDILIWTPL